jgi:hypothetical protein
MEPGQLPAGAESAGFFSCLLRIADQTVVEQIILGAGKQAQKKTLKASADTSRQGKY